MNELKMHQKVIKCTGYLFPGVIVGIIEKLDGQRRYVVECTAKDAAGMLHIFSRDQLCSVE